MVSGKWQVARWQAVRGKLANWLVSWKAEAGKQELVSKSWEVVGGPAGKLLRPLRAHSDLPSGALTYWGGGWE